MKFFKPEDFECHYVKPGDLNNGDILLLTAASAANYANAKLEREGKVVYGSTRGGYVSTPYTEGSMKFPDTHKALLINIEPIEKGSNKILVDKWADANPQEQTWGIDPEQYEKFKSRPVRYTEEKLAIAVEALEVIKNYVDSKPETAHAPDCALVARQALQKIGRG